MANLYDKRERGFCMSTASVNIITRIGACSRLPAILLASRGSHAGSFVMTAAVGGFSVRSDQRRTCLLGLWH
jgi:hypothetical protein